MALEAMPEWLSTAILGAVLAVLGYLGKQVIEWVGRLRAEERGRRARLAELLALIRAGDAAWKVQCENRDRLVGLILERQPAMAREQLGFDRLLALAYPTMAPTERELFDVVRAITVHTFRPLNDALLKWLQADTEFRVRPSGLAPRERLSKYLADLEAHLLLWHAKYEAWIPDHPERALVYLADEERHGIGFPRNGAALVADLLHQRRWVGA